MKLFCLVSDQGTAASEACLCEDHFDEHNKALLAVRAAPDIIDRQNWHDCSENDAVECAVCGKTNQ